MANAHLKAQTTAFTIESILVDACGTPEGENEMVYFSIGSTNLNVSNLSMTWPNNSSKGICQNTNTAKKTKALNKTILLGGYLKEPTSGVLPKNSKVLLITSEDMDTLANSFSALKDTVYVIYQCTGNTSGHFANYTTPAANRTLQLTFASTGSNSVTYDRASLLRKNGTKGAEDGGAVKFSSTGTATYFNDGCQIPITYDISAGTDQTVCARVAVQLSGTGTGYTRAAWFGGKGTFDDSTKLNAKYTGTFTDTPSVKLVLRLYRTGLPTLTDTMVINYSKAARANITTDTLYTCLNQPVAIPGSTANATTLAWTSNKLNPTFSFGAGTPVSNPSFTPKTGDAPVVRLILTATNTCGSASDTVYVRVTPDPTVNAGADISACSGASINLVGTSNATTNKWTGGKGSFANTNATSTTYTLSVNDVNPFYLKLTVTGCSAISDSLLVTPGGKPTVSLGKDSSTCLSDGSVNLIVSSSSGTFTWVANGFGTLTNLQSNSATYTPGASDSLVTFIYSINNGCETASDTQIWIFATPPTKVEAGNPLQVCPGKSTNLSGSGSKGTYLWYGGKGTFGNSVALNTTYFTSPADTGVFYLYLRINGKCGGATDSVQITVRSIPTVKLGNDTIYCRTNSIYLSVQGNQSSYTWSTTGLGNIVNNGNNTIEYQSNAADTNITFYVQSNDPCKVVGDTQIIRFIPVPKVTIVQGDTVNICRNQTVSLFVNSTAASADVVWTTPDGKGSFVSTGPYAVNYVPQQDAENAEITLVASTTNNCGSFNDTIIVRYSDQDELQIIPNGRICQNGTYVLKWFPALNNPRLIGATGIWRAINDTIIIFHPKLGDSLNYITLTGENTCGQVYDSFKVEFLPRVKARIQIDSVNGAQYGETINFKDNSINSLYAKWSFGNGDSSYSTAPVRKFFSLGPKRITLVSTSIDGCSDSAFVNIFIRLQKKFWIPNTFTPGNDNINERYKVYGSGIDTFNMKIFNRWGQVIYEATNIEDEWDGTYKGKLVSDNVFGYLIVVRWIDKSKDYYRGTINVIR